MYVRTVVRGEADDALMLRDYDRHVELQTRVR